MAKRNAPVDIILLLLLGLSLYLIWTRVCPGGTGVSDSPVVGDALEILVIVHHHLGDLGVLGVFGIWRLEEHTQGEQGGLDGTDR